MKQNLFNIESDYLKLMDQIQEADGEITEELAEQLKINEAQLQGKSIAYLSVIKSVEAFNMQIDDEIKRLQQMKKTRTNLIGRLKDRLLEAVNLFGEFTSGTHKFGTRKSSTIEVENVNALPQQYKVVKVTEQADKAELKRAIKDGVEIPGVELVEKLNLKIS